MNKKTFDGFELKEEDTFQGLQIPCGFCKYAEKSEVDFCLDCVHYDWRYTSEKWAEIIEKMKEVEKGYERRPKE